MTDQTPGEPASNVVWPIRGITIEVSTFTHEILGRRTGGDSGLNPSQFIGDAVAAYDLLLEQAGTGSSNNAPIIPARYPNYRFTAFQVGEPKN